MTLKCGLESLKIIENGIIWKLWYGFLFVFHSNYGAILYRLRDIATYFYTLPVFSAPAGVTPVRISWRCLMLIKLKWLGYRKVKNYDNMLSRFHLIPECHGQTDRQTDGRTYVLCQYRASVCRRAIKINGGVECRCVWKTRDSRRISGQSLLNAYAWSPFRRPS